LIRKKFFTSFRVLCGRCAHLSQCLSTSFTKTGAKPSLGVMCWFFAKIQQTFDAYRIMQVPLFRFAIIITFLVHGPAPKEGRGPLLGPPVQCGRVFQVGVSIRCRLSIGSRNLTQRVKGNQAQRAVSVLCSRTGARSGFLLNLPGLPPRISPRAIALGDERMSAQALRRGSPTPRHRTRTCTRTLC